MAKVPSSQTKAKKVLIEDMIKAVQAANGQSAPHLRLTMYGKVLKLRQTKSTDPVQQLQTEIISDLYNAVRAMQVTLDPLLLLLPNLAYSRSGDGYPE